MPKSKRPTFADTLESPDIIKSTIPLDQIGFFPLNPRTWFDPVELQQLADSLKENDLISGIIVRPTANHPYSYEVVVGARRVKAGLLADLSEIKAEVRNLSDREALMLAKEENSNRVDPSFIEDTISTLNLIKIDTGLEHDEIKPLLYQMAKGRNVPTDFAEKVEQVFEDLKTITFSTFVKDRLCLLKLPSSIYDAIQSGTLEPSKARIIARVKDEVERENLLNKVISEKLTVAQIKQEVSKLNGKQIIDYSDVPTEELASQVRTIFGKLSRKQNIWKNPTNRQKIESLLKTLNKLVESE